MFNTVFINPDILYSIVKRKDTIIREKTGHQRKRE